MFPMLKTVKSFKEAKLTKFIVYDILIFIIIVILFVYLSIFLKEQLIHFEDGWLNSFTSFLSGSLSVVISWFMLPTLMPLISGIFLEMVIKNVEDEYYPDNSKREARFWPDIIHDIKFTLYSLFLNILIIPLYFIGIGFIIAILLNSYLLGREFFEAAAGYHIGKPKAKILGKKYKTKIYIGGLVFTSITLIPILNLFVPIIAVVWMVHFYNNKVV